MRFENKLSLCLYSEVLHSHRHQCFRFGPVSARMRQTDKTFSIRMYHRAFSSHFGCTYRLTVGKISMCDGVYVFSYVYTFVSVGMIGIIASAKVCALNFCSSMCQFTFSWYLYRNCV